MKHLTEAVSPRARVKETMYRGLRRVLWTEAQTPRDFSYKINSNLYEVSK